MCRELFCDSNQSAQYRPWIRVRDRLSRAERRSKNPALSCQPCAENDDALNCSYGHLQLHAMNADDLVIALPACNSCQKAPGKKSKDAATEAEAMCFFNDPPKVFNPSGLMDGSTPGEPRSVVSRFPRAADLTAFLPALRDLPRSILNPSPSRVFNS